MRLILFGPPGAGKGTQAALLVERHGLAHISTGRLLRRATRAGTRLGREAEKYLSAGEFVPDELVRRLAEEAVAEAGYSDFILDGYPRTAQQAEWLAETLEAHDAPLTAVLSFEVSDEVLVRRLSGRRVHIQTGENYHIDFNPPPPEVDRKLIIQRKDDRPEVIRRRLDDYRQETLPLLEYYRDRGLVHEIDADASIDEVAQRIDAALLVPRSVPRHED